MTNWPATIPISSRCSHDSLQDLLNNHGSLINQSHVRSFRTEQATYWLRLELIINSLIMHDRSICIVFHTSPSLYWMDGIEYVSLISRSDRNRCLYWFYYSTIYTKIQLTTHIKMHRSIAARRRLWSCPLLRGHYCHFALIIVFVLAYYKPEKKQKNPFHKYIYTVCHVWIQLDR